MNTFAPDKQVIHRQTDQITTAAVKVVRLTAERKKFKSKVHLLLY